MNQTEYKHELIMPNDSIPVKIFSFSAHNDLRIIPSHWHRSAEILYVRRGKLNIWMNKRKYELNRNDFIYINSKEVHSIEYLKDGEEVSSSGYSDINKYLNSIDPDSKIGDAFRKREERSDGSTRYYYDDATIQTLGGEGFNVPTSKGSHSFIRGVQDKLKAVTSAHELLGHGLPSARKESPVHNNTNAIRTDNLVRRLLRLPQRDGSDHAGGKDIVSPYSLPYTK